MSTLTFGDVDRSGGLRAALCTGVEPRQLGSAEEPQRASLVGLLGIFNQQLDRLQEDLNLPAVLDSAPAEPVDDGTLGA